MSAAHLYLPHYTVADYQSWEGDWELWQGIAVSMPPVRLVLINESHATSSSTLMSRSERQAVKQILVPLTPLGRLNLSYSLGLPASADRVARVDRS